MKYLANDKVLPPMPAVESYIVSILIPVFSNNLILLDIKSAECGCVIDHKPSESYFKFDKLLQFSLEKIFLIHYNSLLIL